MSRAPPAAVAAAGCPVVTKKDLLFYYFVPDNPKTCKILGDLEGEVLRIPTYSTVILLTFITALFYYYYIYRYPRRLKTFSRYYSCFTD